MSKSILTEYKLFVHFLGSMCPSTVAPKPPNSFFAPSKIQCQIHICPTNNHKSIQFKNRQKISVFNSGTEKKNYHSQIHISKRLMLMT